SIAMEKSTRIEFTWAKIISVIVAMPGVSDRIGCHEDTNGRDHTPAFSGLRRSCRGGGHGERRRAGLQATLRIYDLSVGLRLGHPRPDNELRQSKSLR